MRLLVTAGPTREALDPVRFLSNKSTGKMGYALAAAGVRCGFQVTLISGPVSLARPEGLQDFISIVSAKEMADAVKSHFADMDALIMCAAVADYRPAEYSPIKIKKKDDGLVLRLERTEDILQSVGTLKQPGQIVAGFAAETNDLQSNAMHKLQKKKIDWIIANDITEKGCGFSTDTNAVTIFGRDGSVHRLPLANKQDIANQILKIILPKK